MWAAIVLLLLGGPEPPSLAWQGHETVAAIQVHGNTVTKDDEVRRLAGIEIGAVVEANTVDEVAARFEGRDSPVYSAGVSGAGAARPDHSGRPARRLE